MKYVALFFKSIIYMTLFYASLLYLNEVNKISFPEMIQVYLLIFWTGYVVFEFLSLKEKS